MVDPYPHKKTLFAIAVILSAFFWIGLVFVLEAAVDRYVTTFGFDSVAAALAVFLIVAYVAGHLRQARRVAYLRGHAVEIGPKQHPDLYARLRSTCKRLGIKDRPNAYLFQNPEVPDCFSLRFGKVSYLALNGEVIGTLTDRQGAIDFVMGHELGRIRDRQARWMPFIFPALVLPLLGPAYARASVYSYDRDGIAACKAKVDAAFALAVIASGSRRWKSFNIPQFASQSAGSTGFWMSLDELSSSVPWLSKRMAHLRAIATNSDAFLPRRNPFAYLVAALIPHIGTRAWRGVLRLIVVVLWIAVVIHVGTVSYQQLTRYGVVDIIMDRLPNITAGQPKPVDGKASTSAKPAREPVVKRPEQAYVRLHADLRALGELALARQGEQGGIPCEIGDAIKPRLNYPWQRYAFSCDEPVVYTVIGHGEFEPGRASHIRKYDWKNKQLILGPSPREASGAAPTP